MIIPKFEIPECPEREVKSKIGIIFVNKKILEEYSAKIYKFGPYFYEHYKEKIQVDKSVREYISFRIHVYFTEYLLAVEIDEKDHTDRDLFFDEKRQEARKKNFVANLLELIRVKKAMMQTIKLVEYKHL